MQNHQSATDDLMINYQLLRIKKTQSELLKRQLISFMMQAFRQYLIGQKQGIDNPKQVASEYFDTLLDWLANGIKKGDQTND